QSDTVAVTRAEYTVSRKQLRVQATSTSSTATLTVYVTATGQLIGTLTNNGGGKYSGQFAWPSNPQQITVRSSLGGPATRVGTVKWGWGGGAPDPGVVPGGHPRPGARLSVRDRHKTGMRPRETAGPARGVESGDERPALIREVDLSGGH